MRAKTSSAASWPIRGTVLRMLDRNGMCDEARKQLDDLGIMTIQNPGQAVETPSGGQRQGGLPVILISHNMPHVSEVADRIHIQRLGRRKAVVDPKGISMSDAVAIMTGAMEPPDAAAA